MLNEFFNFAVAVIDWKNFTFDFKLITGSMLTRFTYNIYEGILGIWRRLSTIFWKSGQTSSHSSSRLFNLKFKRNFELISTKSGQTASK